MSIRWTGLNADSPSLRAAFVALAPAPTGVAATDTANLQALLDAVTAQGGGAVDGAGRQYTITGTLTVDSVTLRNLRLSLTGVDANVRLTGTAPALWNAALAADASTPTDEWSTTGAIINLVAATKTVIDNVEVTAGAWRRAIQVTTRADYTRINALRTYTAWGILYNDTSFIDRTNIEGVDYTGQSIGTGLTITDSDFYGPTDPTWTGDAVEINTPAERFSHVHVANCRVWRTYTSSQVGIGYGFANVDHVTVDGCYATNVPSPAGAFHAEHCTDVKFINNTAYDVRCGVDVIRCTTAKVSGNLFDSCWEFSVKSQNNVSAFGTEDMVDLAITDNTFVGLATANGVTAFSDINAGNASYVTIARNKFLGHGMAGLVHLQFLNYGDPATSVAHAQIVDNVFVNTTGFTPSALAFFESTATGLRARGNTFGDYLGEATEFINRVGERGISEDFYRAEATVAGSKGLAILTGGTPQGWVTGLPGGTARDVVNGVDYVHDGAAWVRKGFGMTVVGTPAAPVSDAGTTRPVGAVIVYWVCANGITPTNAAAGDLIWNAA